MSSVSKAGSTAATAALSGAAGLWFLTAATGQFVFVFYIVRHYGGSAVRGDFAAWTETLINGVVHGDPVGNLALFAHLLLAAIITVGGPLQLLPQLRARLPRFHRWTGRVYLIAAVIISFSGLYMIWTRGGLGPVSNAIALSINALLILVCAAMTVRFALRRDFNRHRRWATRLFLVVSGVWFFRAGLMLWILINGGPVGVGGELDGPFSLVWAYGQYVLPLAVYELYVRARDGGSSIARVAMAATLIILTLGMGVGITAAAVTMWLPYL